MSVSSSAFLAKILCCLIILVIPICIADANSLPFVNGPVLLTEANSTRAIAFEAVTFKRQPISVTPSVPFSADGFNRVVLFAKNLGLLPGEGTSALKVEAQDGAGRIYILPVEYVDRVPGQDWMSWVVCRLHEDMSDNVGDVLVRLTVRGVLPSNRGRLGIGNQRGGPPDDEPSYALPYVLVFDGSAQTVDFGMFWEDPSVDFGKFLWEFWAMPGTGADASYLLTDGYGGAHAILFGFLRAVDPRYYSLYGNVYDGTNITTFISDDGPAPGEWGHFAVGWDGRYIITYFNGVPVGRTAFAGPRRTPGPAGGGGRLLIGGSDHNNLIGRIAQVRGYEGTNPLDEPGDSERITSTFVPETLFKVKGHGGVDSTFITNFLQPSRMNVTWTNESGVTISGSSLRKIIAFGWSAGASSSQSIKSGDGYAEFTATETNTHRMFGLSEADTEFGYPEINYAIYLTDQAGVAVVESGVNRGFFQSYRAGDRFRISVGDGKVRYLKNDIVFYTSDVPPAYPLLVDTSLFSPGATITNAVIAGFSAPLTQVGQVLDLAGDRVGLLRGVGFGIIDPRSTEPPPQFVIDVRTPNAATLSGEGVPPNSLDAPATVPEGALAFDSFSRKSSTFAFDGEGGLGFTEGGTNGGMSWRFGGPLATSGPTTFGILNGRAVILSNGPGIAWVPTSSVTGFLGVQVDRRVGPFGSGWDTGICFRVLDGQNFFFAYTSAGDDEPASKRLLNVGYWLNGNRTDLVTGVPMPESWTTLAVKLDGHRITLSAEGTFVYSLDSTVLAYAQGSGLYNDKGGMALTNRWDKYLALEHSGSALP